MAERHRRLRRRERGAALVETALVLPVIMLLTFGIWATARAWNVHNTLDHAAREAARRGAVSAVHEEMATVARGVVQTSAIDWDQVVICTAIVTDQDTGTALVDSDDGSSAPCIPLGVSEGQDPATDDRVQVTLEIPGYRLDLVFFDIWVDLGARAVARLERGA